MGLIYFLIYVFIELYLLINIGAYMGTLFVIFEIIATVFIGIFLIKSHSLSVLSNMASSIKDLNNMIRERSLNPQNIAGNSILILISGILIIIPGFATDIIGSLLFIYFSLTNDTIKFKYPKNKNNDDIIDAEYKEINIKELDQDKK